MNIPIILLLMVIAYLYFIARPDFVAYNHRDAGKLSRRICSKLGAMSVAWTIRSESLICLFLTVL